MLITFRNTHYKKKKKNLSLVSHSTQFLAPTNSFLRCPTNPFLLFQVFNLNRPIQSLQKKKKKDILFTLVPLFTPQNVHLEQLFFYIKQLSSHFPSSHQISVPKWGNSYYSIAIAIFFLLSETYINRSDKLGSRRKKFKLAGGIGSLNMGCRKK
jgi:hypothetical protein